MNTNILITSAGKRVVLTQMFQKELKSRFPEAKVYTTDMNPGMAPAGIESDGCFQVPRVTADNYIELLLSLCEEHQIGMIVPTIDTELIVLSSNIKLFIERKIVICISSLDFIACCRDKRNTAKFFKNHRIRIPELRDKHHPIFPMFAKPYDGSLSKDLYVIRNNNELTHEILTHPKLIFMEYIDKTEYKEFTVDMYYGKDNRVKSIVPRERIEIRAGEINKGYTRKNYLVEFLKERLEYLPGVIGCICIQFFYRESDNDVVGIEVNPRFGGGYPLTCYAGANYPAFLIEEYFCNQNIEYSDSWKNNTLMLRYDADVIVYNE